MTSSLFQNPNILSPAAPIVVYVFNAFLCFCLRGLTHKRHKMLFLSLTLGTVALCIQLLLALEIGFRGTPISYTFSGWETPLGITLVATGPSAFFGVLASALFLGILLHGFKDIQEQIGTQSHIYFTLSSLVMASGIGMVYTADAFNFYVFLEVSALSSYALLSMGGGRGYFSVFQYLIQGTVGATFYLLGVGFLYAQMGTLSLIEMRNQFLQMPVEEGLTPAIICGLALCLAGLLLKTGLFPLHSWLINAYYYAPNPVNCLIAPLSTKIAVFGCLKMILYLYGPTLSKLSPYFFTIMMGLATISVIAGALYVYTQKSLARTLFALMILEAAYMMGGFSMGTDLGLQAATFHVFHDLIITSAMMMLVAHVYHILGSTNFKRLHALPKKAPYTFAALLFLAPSLIGLPPTSGFASKFFLVTSALKAGYWPFAFALVFASLMLVLTFVGILEKTYFSQKETKPNFKKKELPASSLFLLCSPIALSYLLGFVGSFVGTAWIQDWMKWL